MNFEARQLRNLLYDRYLLAARLGTPETAWWPVSPSREKALLELVAAGCAEIGTPMENGYILAKFKTGNDQ